MFRPLEVIIRLGLEHFKSNMQIALLEMRSLSSSNVVTKVVQKVKDV